MQITDPGLWQHTASLALELIGLHIDAAQAEPGSRCPLDTAWRGVLRDLLDAAIDELDGDRLAAGGALAAGLHDVMLEHDQAAAG